MNYSIILALKVKGVFSQFGFVLTGVYFAFILCIMTHVQRSLAQNDDAPNL